MCMCVYYTMTTEKDAKSVIPLNVIKDFGELHNVHCFIEIVALFRFHLYLIPCLSIFFSLPLKLIKNVFIHNLINGVIYSFMYLFKKLNDQRGCDMKHYRPWLSLLELAKASSSSSAQK